MRFFADSFFTGRYGHRSVVLETIAAAPGMVGGSLQHLKSLRRMESDQGWIRTLLDETENERMHLMTFILFVRPSRFERLLILLVQGAFYNFCFLRQQHIVSWVTWRKRRSLATRPIWLVWTTALTPTFRPPAIAIDYWKLAADARLREVIIAVRADEATHRDVNHQFADHLT